MKIFPAAAKINLALHVTGRRDDGYHLLDSLVVFAEFGDQIQLSPAPTISLDVQGPFSSGLGNKKDNLIVKAAEQLSRRARDLGIPIEGAKITLTKNLPVASGIGGGSADAAATLLGLCELWKIDPAKIDIQKIAIELGADIPMCLHSSPLIARGIGELIEPVKLPPLYLVLVNPGKGIATADIFGRFGGRFSEPLPLIPDCSSVEKLVSWLSDTQNDLQSPAISAVPEIQEVLDALTASKNCLLARMSGSGATCFGIYSTLEEAEKAALDLDQRFPSWWCVASKTIAT